MALGDIAAASAVIALASAVFPGVAASAADAPLPDVLSETGDNSLPAD